jgi:hypothetical protein
LQGYGYGCAGASGDAVSTRGRWLVNGALLIVIGVLAAVAVWRPGTAPPPESYRLTGLAADEVDSIRIEHTGKPTVELVRQDRGWRLTAPFPARAAGHRIDNVLRLTSATSDTRFDAADHDLADFGLAPPATTVRLNNESFGFGANHPLESKRYVLHDGQVYLIASALLWSAEAGDFADPRLLEPGSKLTALRFADFSLRLQDGRWKREPEDPGLSADAITRFADDWRLAQALTVTPSQGGESQGAVEIDIIDPGGKPATVVFDILSRDNGLTLYRPDEQLEYHLAPGSSERLLSLAAPQPQ